MRKRFFFQGSALGQLSVDNMKTLTTNYISTMTGFLNKVAMRSDIIARYSYITINLRKKDIKKTSLSGFFQVLFVMSLIMRLISHENVRKGSLSILHNT